MNSAKVTTHPIYKNIRYRRNVGEADVIEGAFYQSKPMTIREMVTRRVNKSLCFCLLITIFVTFISYYICMNYEANMNNLDNEIVRLNSENQDLQAELDKFKSFNNVDIKIGEFKLLQKAEKVIEMTSLGEKKEQKTAKKLANNKFNWVLGY